MSTPGTTRAATRRGLAGLGGLVFCLLLALAACAPRATVTQKYHCPMHPTYVSDRPGDCPICGMALVPIPPAGTAPGGEASPAPADSLGTHAAVQMEPGALQLAGVRTAPADSGALSRSIRAVGLVQADEGRLHTVTLKSGGWVEKLFVNTTGQAVRRGEPLLELYSPELLATQREYLEALAAADRFGKSDLSEVRQGGVELLESARARLLLFDVPEAFVTALESTRQPRRTVTLTAPVSGYVTARDVVQGARVEAGTPLLTLTDLSRVRVEADLQEYEAAGVAPGQPATLTLDYDPGPPLPVRIDSVYPTLDGTTRTLKVRFLVDNPGLRLKPGLFVTVELPVRSATGVRVPESAVMDTGTRQIVFVETAPGRFEPRAVRVELRADGQALLSSGVAAGERVAVAANFLLDSESRLQSALGGAAAAPAPAAGHAGGGHGQ